MAASSFPVEDTPLVLPGAGYPYTLWSDAYPGHEQEPAHDRWGLYWVGEYHLSEMAQAEASQKAAQVGVRHVVKGPDFRIISQHLPPRMNIT